MEQCKTAQERRKERQRVTARLYRERNRAEIARRRKGYDKARWEMLKEAEALYLEFLQGLASDKETRRKMTLEAVELYRAFLEEAGETGAGK